MSPARADRVIADVVLAERLSVGMYGDVYRAHGGPGRRELRALIVDPRLAADEGFRAAAAATPPALTAFRHRSVVGTVAVALDGRDVVVVTEPVVGPVSLHDVLVDVRARGASVPPPIAAAIARSVVDGLASAQAAGLIHGAVHPRSVKIDFNGAIKLGDLAVARALTVSGAHARDPMLARALAGSLAPELADGEPVPASDVHGVGVLLFAMLTGDLPPGTLRQTPAIERLVQRALDADLGRRLASAAELHENLIEALEDDGWSVASPGEVARFVGDSRSSAEANLDAATEDLLASLGETAKEPPTRRNATPVPVGRMGGRVGMDTGTLDALIEDLGGGRPSSKGGTEVSEVGTGVGADAGDDALTDVDGRRGQLERDPISELLAFDVSDTGPTRLPRSRPASTPQGVISRDQRSDPTPLPVPRPDESTVTVAGQDVLGLGRRIGIATAENRALAAIADLDLAATTQVPAVPSAAAPPPRPRTPLPVARAALPGPELTAPVSLKSRSLGWLWLLLIAGGAGALLWVVSTQTDLIQQAAKDSEAARQRAADETARLTAELPDPGTIRVGSDPDGAAVWLLLGRAPMTSLALPTGMVHQLRVELDGRRARDIVVTGADWTGSGDTRTAALRVALEGAGARARPLPALPPAPPASAAQGLAQGRGTIRVDSTPPGAAVWLLVGVTGSMELGGIEAGRDYDLKVVKDGYVPGYVRFAAEEWRAGGDPRLPLSAAPKKATLERRVELVAEPRRGK